MSQANPLGLIGQYGYSDDSDEEELMRKPCAPRLQPRHESSESATIHPPPVQHCQWSACYDESSGYTYYWNQQTNAVTWEPPAEYLLALKLAQQHMRVTGNSEVSAEEWQLYQQVLGDKQKIENNPPVVIEKKPIENISSEKITKNTKNKSPPRKKRKSSDSEDEKIELITSFQHSDSDSNDESETPVKPSTPPANPPKVVPIPAKVPTKKPKIIEYGPVLPTEQSYAVPIGPEIPPDIAEEMAKVNDKVTSNLDEQTLFKKLKDKTELLEKLGGEIPSDVKNLIKSTQKVEDTKANDIDDLLKEIEKEEVNKSNKNKIDIFNDDNEDSKPDSGKNTPNNGVKSPIVKPLFPSASNIQNGEKEIAEKTSSNTESNKKESNKKKLIISSVVKKKPGEVAPYTTKYSQNIEGSSGNRMGLGFSIDETENISAKETVSYGKDLVFTKGEILNEVKNEKEETDLAALEDSVELLTAKLKFLNEQQMYLMSPVQEMNVQLQTLLSAYRSGALCVGYWQRWCAGTSEKLLSLEESAAPTGWRCYFNRTDGRYVYLRECDGHTQWDYPVVTQEDMDICNTPPHEDETQEPARPPIPSTVRPESVTPPPPGWASPAPEEQPPLPKDPPPRESLGDELMSFYNDIAMIEKQTPTVDIYPPLPPTPSPPKIQKPPQTKKEENKTTANKKVEKEEVKPKKKSKVKISCSVGPKNKDVSSLVARWQQVAEEISSE